jgi:hypothetical protein
MNRKLLATLFGCLSVTALCSCIAAGASVYWLATNTSQDLIRWVDDAPVTSDAPAGEDSAQESSGGPIAAPSSDMATMQENLARAQNAVLPREDLADLAVRFKGVSPAATAVDCPKLRSYEIGATRTFTMSDQDDNTQFTITTKLAHRTDHVYMWVQTQPKGVTIDERKLRKAGDAFEKNIYARTREFFGSEPMPGIDCDPHVHIVHAAGIGSSVGGYFSSPDSFPRAVRPDSNEGQVFVMHAAPGYNGSDPGSDTYMSTMAHEFQHMISFANVHAPDLWLEEGAAQFAERVNEYTNNVGTPYEFAARPETQLNTWQESSAGANGAHYGAGYLFWSYLYDRFGEDTVRVLARLPERSESAFIRELAARNIENPNTKAPYTFEELFADFVVANHTGRNSFAADDVRYRYTSIDVPPMSTYESYDARDFPVDVTETLAQFGTHYIDVRGDATVTVRFDGESAVPLLPMTQRETRGAFWWSNRSDASNPRLTHEFDLSSVSSATLEFRAWYRMERDYDYAYVSVSTDAGATWKLLDTRTCTRQNPQNANLGCGWNGASGGADDPRWVDESADLSAYAGKKILLRFEAVTDAGVNREGLAIDDVRIPEIGFSDAAEADAAGWKSEGWVRVSNALPQRWSVQAILIGRDGSRRLQRMAIDDVDGRGEIKLNLTRRAGLRNVVLAISPTTQVTTQPATYQLRIE